jgi:hypothetical protein
VTSSFLDLFALPMPRNSSFKVACPIRSTEETAFVVSLVDMLGATKRVSKLWADTGWFGFCGRLASHSRLASSVTRDCNRTSFRSGFVSSVTTHHEVCRNIRKICIPRCVEARLMKCRRHELLGDDFLVDPRRESRRAHTMPLRQIPSHRIS